MTLQVAVGSGLIETTDSGDKDFNLSNFGGETPKVVIMFPSQQDADGRFNHARWGMGVLTNTLDYLMAVRMQNNVNPSNTLRTQSGVRCLGACDTTSPAIAWNARGKTTDPLTADKFTLNVVQSPGVDRRFGYLALGGTDLEVEVGSFALEDDAQQTITGLSFEPEALILMTVREPDDIEGVIEHENDARLSIGFSDGSTEFNCCAISDDNDNPIENQKTTRNDTILSGLSFGGGLNDGASLNSFTSDGFILDLSPTWPLGAKVVYVALRGVQFKTGSTTHQTSTGNFAITGVGFQGKALMMLQGGNQTAFNNVSVDAVMYGGFARSATERWTSGFTDNEEALDDNSLTQTVNDDDKCLVRYAANGTSVTAEIDFVSWDSDGFTLDQVDANNNTHVIAYLVIGALPVVDVDEVNLRGNLKTNLLGGFE